MAATYEYDPSKLSEYGKDRMRFELGDVMTDGKEATCALCDEEYDAIISEYKKKSWKTAKLHCLESIFRRMAYEPDTTDGPVSLKFGDRAKLWQDMYNKLKDEVAAEDIDPKAIDANLCPDIRHRDPYFYLGMMSRKQEGV